METRAFGMPQSSPGDLKTYFIVKDRQDYSIAKVIVASCDVGDFAACGRAVFATGCALRSDFPSERYTIDTITATKLDLPQDKSLIEERVIP